MKRSVKATVDSSFMVTLQHLGPIWHQLIMDSDCIMKSSHNFSMHYSIGFPYPCIKTGLDNDMLTWSF